MFRAVPFSAASIEGYRGAAHTGFIRNERVLTGFIRSGRASATHDGTCSIYRDRVIDERVNSRLAKGDVVSVTRYVASADHPIDRALSDPSGFRRRGPD